MRCWLAVAGSRGGGGRVMTIIGKEMKEKNKKKRKANECFWNVLSESESSYSIYQLNTHYFSSNPFHSTYIK